MESGRVLSLDKIEIELRSTLKILRRNQFGIGLPCRFGRMPRADKLPTSERQFGLCIERT
jgi:hypothetical protein